MKKKNLGKFVIVFIVLVMLGGILGWRMYNKPHKKAEDIKGIALTVSEIANEFSTNEEKAKANYLDKVIEVSGTVSEVTENQDGQLLVIMTGEDPTASVQCSMRDKGIALEEGQGIIVKGFCSGLSLFDDVMLTDCVLVE